MTLKEAVDELEATGSVDGIAKLIEAEGIVVVDDSKKSFGYTQKSFGYTSRSCGCPLATYLKKKIGQTIQVFLTTCEFESDVHSDEVFDLPPCVLAYREHADKVPLVVKEIL